MKIHVNNPSVQSSSGSPRAHGSRMPPTPQSLVLVMVLLFGATALTHATEPGAQLDPEEERDLSATLYVSAVGSEKGTLTGLALAWVPAEYEARCLGKTFDECWNVARHDQIDPKDPNLLPPRLLQDWLNTVDHQGRDKPVLRALASCPCISAQLETGGHREKKLPLAKSCMVQADLHYTLWPNGDSFEVMKAGCLTP